MKKKLIILIFLNIFLKLESSMKIQQKIQKIGILKQELEARMKIIDTMQWKIEYLHMGPRDQALEFFLNKIKEVKGDIGRISYFKESEENIGHVLCGMMRKLRSNNKELLKNERIVESGVTAELPVDYVEHQWENRMQEYQEEINQKDCEIELLNIERDIVQTPVEEQLKKAEKILEALQEDMKVIKEECDRLVCLNNNRRNMLKKLRNEKIENIENIGILKQELEERGKRIESMKWKIEGFYTGPRDQALEFFLNKIKEVKGDIGRISYFKESEENIGHGLCGMIRTLRSNNKELLKNERIVESGVKAKLSVDYVEHQWENKMQQYQEEINQKNCEIELLNIENDILEAPAEEQLKEAEKILEALQEEMKVIKEECDRLVCLNNNRRNMLKKLRNEKIENIENIGILKQELEERGKRIESMKWKIEGFYKALTNQSLEFFLNKIKEVIGETFYSKQIQENIGDALCGMIRKLRFNNKELLKNGRILEFGVKAKLSVDYVEHQWENKMKQYEEEINQKDCEIELLNIEHDILEALLTGQGEKAEKILKSLQEDMKQVEKEEAECFYPVIIL